MSDRTMWAAVKWLLRAGGALFAARVIIGACGATAVADSLRRPADAIFIASIFLSCWLLITGPGPGEPR